MVLYPAALLLMTDQAVEQDLRRESQQEVAIQRVAEHGHQTGPMELIQACEAPMVLQEAVQVRAIFPVQ